MFDRNVELELTLPSENGEKEVVLAHFPSDQAICDKFKTQYVLMRDLGNGESENKMMGEEDASLRMIRSAALPSCAELDGAEADTISRQLLISEVVDTVRDGGYCIVTLVTPDMTEGLGNCETKHTVRIPSHKELKYWRESSVRLRSVRNNASQMRTYLDGASELYDKYFSDVEGYVLSDKKLKDIPVHHKHRVLEAIDAEIRQIRTAVHKDKSSLGTVPTIPGQNLQA